MSTYREQEEETSVAREQLPPDSIISLCCRNSVDRDQEETAVVLLPACDDGKQKIVRAGGQPGIFQSG